MARSPADAFLEAILQDPDDDTPRLIFADWLEERGDSASAARAEFIRVQCALAGKRPHRRGELEKRQQQLLDEWDKEWARPLRRLIQLQEWGFHRGFIDYVAMCGEKFFTQASKLFRRAPIQHLWLWSYDDSPLNVAALAENRYLRRLRSLVLARNRLDSQGVRALLVSEHLTGLTELDLSHNRIGDSGIRALAASPLLRRLKYLNLCGNDMGTNGLRALAESLEALACSLEGLRLQRLELTHENLRASARRVIAESPLLQRLVNS